MANLANIRDAMAAALEERVNGFNINAYMLANPSPPAIHIIPGEVDYHQAANDGLEFYTMLVQALVNLTGDYAGQLLLDQLIDTASPNSVKQALEADTTLGGVVDDLTVVKTRGYHIFHNIFVTQPGNSRDALGAEWTVWVYAKGD